MISTRIEKQYDYISNDWETNVHLLIHQQALFSGFLAEIPPLQLHTLTALALFMKDNGKIEISVADFARALGISFHQAQKRIDDLAGFRFRDKPVITLNKSRNAGDTGERISLSILPLSPITFVDEREQAEPPAFTPDNSDYLFEYLRMMTGVAELSEQDKELLVSLQAFPYELPPQVIEVLIEHVMEYKDGFDKQYLMTIAHSWSNNGVCTKEKAERWVKETSLLTSPLKTDNSPEAYLLQYLRERIRKQPSSIQINMIFQLLEEPFSLEPGCVEVLIDHVVAQISLAKGKPDFPKKYVEAVMQDWMERGVRTREAALLEVQEWNNRYSIKPAEIGDKKDKRVPVPRNQGMSKSKNDILEKFRKAGLK